MLNVEVLGSSACLIYARKGDRSRSILSIGYFRYETFYLEISLHLLSVVLDLMEGTPKIPPPTNLNQAGFICSKKTGTAMTQSLTKIYFTC